MASKRRMKNRRTKSKFLDWSSLPKELLEIILAKLGLVGHVRCSAVCKWWRCVAAENPPIEKPFALVRYYNPRRLICRLLSPMLLNPFWSPPSVEAQFIGIFGEWLVMKQVCLGGLLFLLNPSLGSQALIPLPPPPSQIDTKKVVLSASPSSENCMIVLCDSGYRLAFWRFGDTTTGWTFFLPANQMVHDPVFQPGYQMVHDLVFHNNQLYILDRYSGIKVFDSGLNTGPTLMKFQDGMIRSGKLVSVFGKLLLIQNTGFPSGYKVFELDPRDLSCTLLKSIGDDNILFFSSIGYLSLSTKDHKDLRPNHLYSNYPYPNGSELFSYSLSRKTLTWEGVSIIPPVFFTLFKHECAFRLFQRGMDNKSF